MAKTNTDARWLPGANMEQSASRIRDILFALSAMLQNHNADEVKGLIQSIVDLMGDDNDQSIGQQLTRAINEKASITALDVETTERKAAVTALDNKKVDKTNFDSYRSTTATTLSTIQGNVTSNTNKLTTVENGLNTANTEITRLEGRERFQINCLNGFINFNSGMAYALVSKMTSCLLFAEKDCPNGLCLTDADDVTIEGTDENGYIVPLYAEHLYVFSYIHYTDGKDDELRLAVDIPVNTDGRHWFSGSEISHPKNAREYDFEGKLGDMYLNVETLCIYRCNGLSKNNLYEWAYIGQWMKTSDIRMENLSKELQDIINSKSGETFKTDIIFDSKSNNAIANSPVTIRFQQNEETIDNLTAKVTTISNQLDFSNPSATLTYQSLDSSPSLGEVINNWANYSLEIHPLKLRLFYNSQAISPIGESENFESKFTITPENGWGDSANRFGKYELQMTVKKDTDGIYKFYFDANKIIDSSWVGGENGSDNLKGDMVYDTATKDYIFTITIGWLDLYNIGDDSYMMIGEKKYFYNCNNATFTFDSSETGGDSSITIDDTLSETSINPVQNKVIKAALDEKVSTTQYATETTPGIVTLHRGGAGNNSGLLVGDKGELTVNVSDGRYGLTRDGAGQIKTFAATEADIDTGTNQYKPIVPANLNYAIKKVVANAENQYSTTPQRVGTWIDGTPIWRVAYSHNLNTGENWSLGYITGDPDVSVPSLLSNAVPAVIDTINKIIPIKGFMYFRAFDNDSSLLKELMCPLLGTGFYTNGADLTKYTSVDAWLEFATPTNNIQTST